MMRAGCQRIAERSLPKSDRPASFMTTTSPSMIADFAGKPLRRLDDRQVLRAPVEAAAREGARLAALDDELRSDSRHT